MSITEELLAGLEQAAADPAFINKFKKQLIDTGMWEKMGCPPPLMKKLTPPPAAPALADITAIRAGMWDNWPGGFPVKNRPNRYALTINLWTAPAEEIEVNSVKRMNFEFSCNMALLDAKAMRKQIRHLKRPRKNDLSTVDPEYLDGLTDVIANRPDLHFGMINTNIRNDVSEYERGVYYPTFQFLYAKMDDGKIKEANLIINGERIALAPFVEVDSHGDKLKGVIAQSRLDLCGFDLEWTSGRSDPY